MIEQTKLMKATNIVFEYLILSLLMIVLAGLTMGLLLIPVLISTFRVIKKLNENEIDAYSSLINIYFNEFKTSFKYLRYILLNVYYLLVLFAIHISSTFLFWVINMTLAIILIYIIIFITAIVSQQYDYMSFKDIYKEYALHISLKNKIRILLVSLIVFICGALLNIVIIIVFMIPIIYYIEFLLKKRSKYGEI